MTLVCIKSTSPCIKRTFVETIGHHITKCGDKVTVHSNWIKAILFFAEKFKKKLNLVFMCLED